MSSTRSDLPVDARISDKRSSYGQYFDLEVLNSIKECVKEHVVPTFKEGFSSKEREISKEILPLSTEPETDAEIGPPPYPGVDEVEIDYAFIEKEILENTTTGDFQLVTSLTQESINSNFAVLWNSARRIHEDRTNGRTTGAVDKQQLQLQTCLAYFSYEKEGGSIFEAKFTAPKVELLFKEGLLRARLFLHMSSGRSKPEGSESK